MVQVVYKDLDRPEHSDPLDHILRLLGGWGA